MFDEYLQQCESRLAKHDLSLATVVGYRKVLDSIWRLRLRALPFLQVRYSMLVKIADSHKAWSKKTYNNAVSGLRRAFAFGYREGAPVAEFGTRCGTIAAQVPEEKEKESGGEGGIRTITFDLQESITYCFS